MSPTQHCIRYFKQQKWIYQTVERWNPFAKRRIDLFGCIDIVVLNGSNILGIQTTSPSGHAARIRKSYLEPKLSEWLKCGGLFEVWSWKRLAKRTYADKHIPGVKKFTARVTKFNLKDNKVIVDGTRYDGKQDPHLERIVNNKGNNEPKFE